MQRYSIHDGPGIRTTVFLKGCPPRCLHCQNAESQISRPEVLFVRENRTGCGAFADPALQALVMDVARPEQRGSAMATCFAMVDMGITAGSRVSGRTVPGFGYRGVFATANLAPLLGLAGFLGTARLHRLQSRDV